MDKRIISVFLILVLNAGFVFAETGIEKKETENEKPLTVNMEEVVVTAYGKQTKGALTGASTTISGPELTNIPVTSITSALMGKSPGLQSTLSDGQPGSSPSLRIRGFGSVNASNEPLYVVDGYVYSGAISDINPQDIESVTILKDAASTALYGSSAGNGVVLINTKKAPQGKENTVNLHISQGFTKKGVCNYDQVGLWDYYPLQWEMLKNQYINGSGQDATTAAQNASANLYSLLGGFNIFKDVPNDQIVTVDGVLNPLATTLLYDDFDWEGASFKTGYRADYTLSYSTRTEKSNTYASVNVLDNSGPMIQTDYKRYGGRINYNITPNKWFETGLNLTATYAKAKTPMTNMTFTTAKGNFASFIRKMAPIYPVYLHNEDGSFKLDSDGNKMYDYTSKRISLSGRHVIAEAEKNKRGYKKNSYTGNTYVAIKPIKGLKLSVTGSLESSNDRAHVYYNTVVADGAPAGRIQQTTERFQTYSFNQLINYHKRIKDNEFEILLGHENFDYSYNYMYVYKQKEIMEGLYELDNFSTLSKLTSLSDEYHKESYFARVSYNYGSRYYGNASFRRDGSSRFAKKSRWGNFWSIGASWRAEQEEFLKGISWIDYLKLRASYGEVGNDGILKAGEADYYPWQTLYSSGVNNSSEAGLYFNVLGNENLKWETQKTWDIAVEFSFLSRLSGTIEYFNRNSDNLLFNVPVALSNGVTSIWQNLGKVRNSGVEIDLSYDYINRKDWYGTIGANMTYLKNKVVKMPAGLKEIVTTTNKVSEGHSIYEFYLRNYWGANPANGDALYVLDPETGNPEAATTVEIDGRKLTSDPNSAEYHFCGSSIPKFFGGFYSQLRYKSFTLNLQFSYGLGSKIYDASYAEMMANQMGFAMHKDMLKAWKKEGDKTQVPRLDASKNSTYGVVSDRFLVKGDYLVFQGASFTYDLPKSLLAMASIEKASVSICGENMAQWNHRHGVNALSNFTGYTYNLYMPSKVYSININLTF